MERVAELAMRVGRRHLADYGAARSRHDFTQSQLMACLILRVFLKTTYRGVLEVLAVSEALRARLGLCGKLPHYTTLQKFSTRSRVAEIAAAMAVSIGRRLAAPGAGGGAPAPAAAMDATGLSRTTVSDYFTSKRGRRFRRWVQVSAIILCGSLLPIAVVADLAPSHDCAHAPQLLAQAQAGEVRPARLYADSGYDAEWLHAHCREQWGVPAVIPPVQRRADGGIGGHWRPQMTAEYLRQNHYTSRWEIESYFSGLKRTMGGALSARRPDQMLAEASLKVLAYAIRR
jgi:hypothetical protein